MAVLEIDEEMFCLSILVKWERGGLRLSKIDRVHRELTTDDILKIAEH